MYGSGVISLLFANLLDADTVPIVEGEAMVGGETRRDIVVLRMESLNFF